MWQRCRIFGYEHEGVNDGGWPSSSLSAGCRSILDSVCYMSNGSRFGQLVDESLKFSMLYLYFAPRFTDWWCRMQKWHKSPGTGLFAMAHLYLWFSYRLPPPVFDSRRRRRRRMRSHKQPTPCPSHGYLTLPQVCITGCKTSTQSSSLDSGWCRPWKVPF